MSYVCVLHYELSSLLFSYLNSNKIITWQGRHRRKQRNPMMATSIFYKFWNKFTTINKVLLFRHQYIWRRLKTIFMVTNPTSSPSPISLPRCFSLVSLRKKCRGFSLFVVIKGPLEDSKSLRTTVSNCYIDWLPNARTKTSSWRYLHKQTNKSTHK